MTNNPKNKAQTKIKKSRNSMVENSIEDIVNEYDYSNSDINDNNFKDANQTIANSNDENNKKVKTTKRVKKSNKPNEEDKEVSSSIRNKNEIEALEAVNNSNNSSEELLDNDSQNKISKSPKENKGNSNKSKAISRNSQKKQSSKNKKIANNSFSLWQKIKLYYRIFVIGGLIVGSIWIAFFFVTVVIRYEMEQKDKKDDITVTFKAPTERIVTIRDPAYFDDNGHLTENNLRLNIIPTLIEGKTLPIRYNEDLTLLDIKSGPGSIITYYLEVSMDFAQSQSIEKLKYIICNKKMLRTKIINYVDSYRIIYQHQDKILFKIELNENICNNILYQE